MKHKEKKNPITLNREIKTWRGPLHGLLSGTLSSTSRTRILPFDPGIQVGFVLLPHEG